jgi:hypothetical protein
MVDQQYQAIRELSCDDDLPLHSKSSKKESKPYVQYLTALLIFGVGLGIGYFLSNWIHGPVAAAKHLVPCTRSMNTLEY